MAQKKALVTGASSGIGWVFAEALAKDGYTVTCVARGENKLKELVKKLGDSHRFLTADLTHPEQLDTVCRDIKENNYALVVNNAGYGRYDYFHKIPFKDHEHLLNLNINALVQISHTYLQTATDGDALVNVSSALSLLTYPGGAIYAGSKAFVTNFTESLWYEYKDKGIYVMALLPGLTHTNFHKVAFQDEKTTIPEKMGYPTEVVVAESMKALKKRKTPSIISGPRFRFLTKLMTKWFKRKRMISLMGARNPKLN